MIKRRTLLTSGVLLLTVAVSIPLYVNAQQRLPVVATFSILGDMVKRIGGNAVAVTTLVGRNGDTHVYQPTPADARAVKEASVLFTNGLGFEGWLDRLAEAAEFDGELVVTTNGIDVISLGDHDGEDHHVDEHAEEQDKHDEKAHESDEHDEEEHEEEHDEEHEEGGHEGEHHHGEFDPHGWQSLQNARVYVDNITTALAKASPSDASTFYENRASYMAEIDLLDKKIKDVIVVLPQSARTIVTSHDAFQYFGRDYGLRFIAPQGLSTESEASAQDVAQLITQIRAEGTSAVFVENVADPRLIQQIATETGSVVGGKLFPGALSSEDGPAPTYLDLMTYNALTIATALTDSKK